MYTYMTESGVAPTRSSEAGRGGDGRVQDSSGLVIIIIIYY